MKMIGNVSDWLSYAGGALIKVADSAGLTVVPIINCPSHAPGSYLAMPRGSIVSMHRLSLVDSQLI